MKIYISGKITGTTDYKERFQEADDELKSEYPDAEIVNPVKLCEHLTEGTSWEHYMVKDLKELKACTHIYFLKGWEKSRGARVEFCVAVYSDIQLSGYMPVLTEDEGINISKAGKEDVEKLTKEYDLTK